MKASGSSYLRRKLYTFAQHLEPYFSKFYSILVFMNGRHHKESTKKPMKQIENKHAESKMEGDTYTSTSIG